MVTKNAYKREVHYINIRYGKNIVIMSRETTSNETDIKLKDVNLSTKKYSYFLITTNKQSICNDGQNLVTDVSS